MVAIVSGNSLGLNSTSLATLGQLGLAGSAAQGRNGQAAYVNAATGNLVVQVQDDLLAGRGPDATGLRTYNSQGQFNDDNGDNWTTGFFLQPLQLAGTVNTAGSTLSRTDRDGSVAIYSFDAAAILYRSTDGGGAHDTIVFVAAENQFEWRDGSTGVTERYEATGARRLLATADPSGNRITYAYDAAGRLLSETTANGESRQYAYTAAGNLYRLVSFRADGTPSAYIQYLYDASNRLTRAVIDHTPGDFDVSDWNRYITDYEYDGSSKRVARILQDDGSRLAFTYVEIAGSWRVASVTDALNQVTRFAYGTGYATVTDALGLVTRYDFDSVGRLTCITGPAVAGASATRLFAYNASGDVVSATDGEGRSVQFGYDANGNQVLQRDGAGNTVTRSFDARNQLLTETVYVVPDPDGAGAAQPAEPLATRYVYDAGGHGLLRFVLSAEGRVTEYRYNAFGERVTSVTYRSAAYPVAGLPQQAVPTEAQLVAWGAAQDLAATERVDFSYDARGQLQARTTYGSVTTAGVGVLDAACSVEQYVYDSTGRLLQTVSAGGGRTLYTYDGLGRVLANTDALGQVTLTRYDDAGRKTVATTAAGLVTTTAYDAAGRVMAVSQSNIAGAVLGETRYFYDAVGRLRMTQDPTGIRTWTLYDEAGRKAADIDGNGTLVEYAWDRSDRLARTTTWGTAVNTAALTDAAGLPVLSASLSSLRPAAGPADATVWRMYDASGRLARTAKSVGSDTAAVTETRYDGASRVVATVQYANFIPATGAALAAGTVPLPSASPQDRITRNFHDADGRLVGSLDAEGYLTAIRHDAAGRPAERIVYARATEASLRAAGSFAQLIPAASADDVRSVTLFDAKGQVIGEVDGEDYLTEYVYDAGGNVARTVRYANRVTAVASMGSSLAAIRPAASASDRATSRVYDALDRIVQETNPEGVVTRYAYDLGGRLVSTERAAGTGEVRTLLARFDLQGRLVGELSAEGAARLTGGQTQQEVDAVWSQYGQAHTYDAAGRRVSTRDAAGNTSWFYYDADGALRYTVNALGEVRENRYDVQGRLQQQVTYASRTAVRGPGGLLPGSLAIAPSAEDSVVTYTYTRDGQVATELDAEGHMTTRTYNSFGEEIGRTEAISAGVTLEQTVALDRRGLRVGSTQDATGVNAIVTTSYDAFGRVTRMVDANGQVHEQAFDRLGRVVTTQDPAGGLRSTSYDAFGRELAQTDALGNTTRYTYDNTTRTMTVTTPEGLQSTTVANRHGEVQTVTDGKGNATRYEYDRDGRLLRTTTPLTVASTTYDGAGRTIETTDASGNVVRYTYDAANRVLSRQLDPVGLNLTTSYAYDGKGQQVTVTDANGVATKLEYDRNGRTFRQTVDPEGLQLQTVYSFDAKGRVLTVTNPGGTLTKYVYDALGRRKQEIVDPAGLNLQRTWTYDKNGNVLGATDATGNLTRYAYDDAGRRIFTLDAAGNLQQQWYDGEGRVVKTTAYATALSLAGLEATWTAGDVQARVVSRPDRDVVEHRMYDQDGQLAATVDGTGGVVRFVHDANGNVVSRIAHAARIDLSTWIPGTPPAAVADAAHDSRLDTVYDALNRVLYTRDGSGAVVAQRYDGNGNLLERTAFATAVPVDTPATEPALATAVAMVADAARDASVRNTFDRAKRLTWSVDGTGSVTQRVYDRNGNLVRQVAYATSIAAGAIASAVPASAGDRATSMAYDAANRMVFSVDAMNGVTEQVYDAEGRVVRRIAYERPIATVPALGASGSSAAIRAAIASSALDRATRYGFDAAGRQILEIDAEGAATQTQRDGAGNAIGRTAYARRVDLVAASSAGSLSALQALVVPDAAADRSSRFAYDAAGRLLYEVDSLGAVTANAYDGAGRIVSTRRYMSLLPAGAGTSAAAIAAALAPDDLVDRVLSYEYDAAGRRTAATDAAGTERYEFDALGRKLRLVNRKGAAWAYDYDAQGRLTRETSPQVLLTSTTIQDGQVVAGTSQQGWAVTLLAYDALGNLVRRTEAAGRPGEERVTRYEYDAAGRQVRVVFPETSVYDAAADDPLTNGATGVAARREIRVALETRTWYDALGNAVAGRDVGGGLSQKAYDRAGHVIYEVDALGFVTGYGRDAFGSVTTLTRYAAATSLAARVVVSASGAATLSEVQAALAGADHTSDRVLRTFYDRSGRVAETWQPEAYAYDSSAATGQQRFTAAARTRNSYNAFGELVQVGTARDASGSSWLTTTHYFDKAGRETGTVDALGYLTSRAFDAAGNVTAVIERATALTPGAWNASTYGSGPAASNTDRTTLYAYDRVDRVVAETRSQVEYSSGSDGTSTRGDLTTQYGYDAVGNRTRITDALGNTSWTVYDQLGRIAAVAAPFAAGSGKTPLTEYRRDAHGNVVVQVEYANGAAAASSEGVTAGPAAAEDRITLTHHDLMGRASATTDANGASSHASFDAFGHLAKSWRGVTGLDGVTHTAWEVHRYDALGQLVETSTPASGANVRAGLRAAFSVDKETSGTEIRVPQHLRFEWSGLTDPGGATVRLQADYVSLGVALSATQDFSAAEAAGGAALTWMGPTDSIGALRVLQMVDGQWTTRWQGTMADATGSELIELSQTEAGSVQTNQEFNAFGELTRKGMQGGRQEYFDYDRAGRLWRTNSGDGVDRIQLYDLQGNVTADIRSSGSGRDDIDVKGFINAQAADANPYTRRVDTLYDALGHVTARVDAARLEQQGGAWVMQQYTTASVLASASAADDGSGRYYWGGRNEVRLGWNSLASLGSGDVRVTIGYRTGLIAHGGDLDEFQNRTPITYTGGVAREYRSGVLNGDASAAGATLSWLEPVTPDDGGISEVTHLRVEKKNVAGEWVVVVDQAPGYGRNEIDVAAPPDPLAATRLELRRSGDATWFGVELNNFGSGYRFDAGALAVGSYDYRVLVTVPGQAEATAATGSVAITRPPLNAITVPIVYAQVAASVLSWPAPASTTQQVFRYRASGSSGSWGSLAVSAYKGDLYSGVDTSGLVAGSYEFELLWTPAGQGVPTAHATGTMNVADARAAYWVPPANLPPITGLRIGSTGLQTASTLEWDAANANSATYSSNGSTWQALTIDDSHVNADEWQPGGVQRVSLYGLAANTYAVRIYAGWPSPTLQATANVTIYAKGPGHYETVYVQVPTYTPVVAYYEPVYETRYGTRTVSYQVWVVDQTYPGGYDENGNPIYYIQIGHWETRYTTETYAYQVQVGQTPVYQRDEYGNIVYQVSWSTETQQKWVEGTTPTPTVEVTTPPYTPGYWVAAVPQQVSVQTSTGTGSASISTDEGAVIGQSAALNGTSEWERPIVYQTSDRWGNVLQVTDPRSAVWSTSYRYNAANQVVHRVEVDATGAGNPITSVYYDGLGRQVAVRDARNNVNSQFFDAAGSLVREQHADGGVVTHAYDALGRKVRTSDDEGGAQSFRYDRMGNLLAAERGTAQTYRVAASNVVELASSGAVQESWTYDELGHRLTHTNGNGEVVRYRYDLRGNVIGSQQPLGQSTRSAFDAQGHKIVEVDAEGYVSTWTYDYFGQLTGHTDLGGARYAYSYDHARQLVAQTNTRGQRLEFGYDAAGQVVRIRDGANGKETTYAYDAGGRKIRERVTQGGLTYQDNHLAYDAIGNLRDVADARVHITMQYDKAGNRTYVGSYVDYQGLTAETSQRTDRYFQYDAMNRQVLVDAVDAAGALGTQGHRITYDHSGNRTSDTYWGTTVTANAGQVITGYDSEGGAHYGFTLPPTYTKGEGYTTEVYRYDGLHRLLDVQRDGTQIDLRLYDGADRVVRSGPTNLPVGYTTALNEGLAPGEANGKEIRTNRYDANGRLLHQIVQKSDGSEQAEISWDPAETLGDNTAFRAAGYDRAGNATEYTVRDASSGSLTRYTTALARFDSYQAGVTTAKSTVTAAGTSTQGYDANGFLVSVTDATQSLNNRTFVNDAGGRSLYVNQGGKVQRQLVVNGEVLGTYGVGVDPAKPTNGGNPNFANLADFDFGYAPISASYPNASPGAYQVRPGDTLQSIAHAAYGDTTLWYRIAEANGLASSTDLKVGQTLNIPNRVSTIHNDATTFKPYDPSRITGDTSPNLPMPGDADCGGVGQVLMVVVGVAVTLYTAGAMSGATGGFLQTMSFGVSALGAGAAGSTVAVSALAGAMAGQGVGLATGAIKDLDWRSLALSAVSAGLSARLPPGLTSGVGSAERVVARAVLSNALTQGIGVAVGLQRRFDWRGIAAAGIGTAVGAHVGDALGIPATGARSDAMTAGDFFARSFVKGMSAGLAAAAVRGGRVVVQQVAVDAFGNALGSSVAQSANSTNDPSSYFYDGEMDRQSDAAYNAWQQAELTLPGGNLARFDGRGYRSLPAEEPALVNGLSFSEDAVLRKWTNDPYGLRNAAEATPQVAGRATLDLGQAHDQWASTGRKPMYDFGDPFQVDGAGPLAQVRVVRGSSARPATVNGVSINNKNDALLNAAAEGDIFGIGNMYRDYKLLSGLMSEGMKDQTLNDLKKQLQERLGVMRSVPSEDALGARVGIGADGVARHDKADLIDRYSDALRKLGLARQGVIELDYATFQIQSIGNAKLTPAQYLAEVETRYQRAYRRGVEVGDERYARGALPYPSDMPKQLQVGLFGDDFGRRALFTYHSAIGVPEGPGQIISLNRWAYDPQGTGLYVRHDVLVDLGPNQRYWVDGKTSLTESQNSTRQFEIFYRYTNAVSGKVATPQGLFNVLPNGKVRR